MKSWTIFCEDSTRASIIIRNMTIEKSGLELFNRIILILSNSVITDSSGPAIFVR
jgi:hypothetical protein